MFKPRLETTERPTGRFEITNWGKSMARLQPRKLTATKKSVSRLKAELKSLNSALAKLRKRRQAVFHDIEQTGTKIIRVQQSKPPKADLIGSNATRKMFEELRKLDKSIIEVRYSKDENLDNSGPPQSRAHQVTIELANLQFKWQSCRLFTFSGQGP